MASIIKFLGLLLLIDAGWLLLKLADAYSYTPEAGICYQLGRCTSISPGVSSLVIFFIWLVVIIVDALSAKIIPSLPTKCPITPLLKKWQIYLAGAVLVYGVLDLIFFGPDQFSRQEYNAFIDRLSSFPYALIEYLHLVAAYTLYYFACRTLGTKFGRLVSLSFKGSLMIILWFVVWVSLDYFTRHAGCLNNKIPQFLGIFGYCS